MGPAFIVQEPVEALWIRTLQSTWSLTGIASAAYILRSRAPMRCGRMPNRVMTGSENFAAIARLDRATGRGHYVDVHMGLSDYWLPVLTILDVGPSCTGQTGRDHSIGSEFISKACLNADSTSGREALAPVISETRATCSSTWLIARLSIPRPVQKSGSVNFARLHIRVICTVSIAFVNAHNGCPVVLLPN